MRLCDDETGYFQLFLAVLPAFVNALPPPPNVSAPGSSRRRETLKNAVTLLRFEVRDMQHVLAGDRTSYDLSVDEFSRALEALEDVLWLLQDLVDNTIPVSQVRQHPFPKLVALRDIVGGGDMSYPFLPQGSRWISFGDAVTHFRQTCSEIQIFNKIMRGIFDGRTAAAVSQIKQPFYQQEYTSSDDEIAMSELADAKRLSDTANILLKSLAEETEGCQVPHTAHIHLSGFTQPEIDMLMSVCGGNGTGKWHHVSWSSGHHNSSTVSRAQKESICSTLKRSWRFKKRLRIRVNRDGAWNCTESSAEDRVKNKVKAPTLRLEELLHPKHEVGPAAIKLLKKDKLQLANAITKSLLCLLGSPLVTDAWKTETIYIAQVLDRVASDYPLHQPYILREITREMLEYEAGGSESVLYLGVLLWELLFGRKITITPEDEEDDDEDLTLSLFNALSREENDSRESCIEKPALDIIANCLNIYPETELDDQELRSKVYWNILRPLKSYVEVFQSDNQAQNFKEPALFPPLNETPGKNMGINVDIPFSSLEHSQTKMQYSYNNVFHRRDTHKMGQPPLPSSFVKPQKLSALPEDMTAEVHHNGSTSYTASVSILQVTSAEEPSIPLLNPNDYRIGIVCALPKELLAVRALFDEKHKTPKIAPEDTNEYALGRLAHHNVVTACLPFGVYGTNPAAQIITHMGRTFPSIRSYLLVGIGAGVPSKDNDVRLGDVVVSLPTGGYPGVIQYDRGKVFENDEFERTGSLPPPPQTLLNAISHLRADPHLPSEPLQPYIQTISNLRPEYDHPGLERDPAHVMPENCNGHRIRTNSNPRIHYGLIASGNQVIKNAQTRDRLGQKYNVLCIEMEAAGIVNVAPCLVVRGICDYADAMKDKAWQEYASATAAAYAKLLLSHVRDDGP